MTPVRRVHQLSIYQLYSRPGVEEGHYETETEASLGLVNSVACESKTNRYALLSITYLK